MRGLRAVKRLPIAAQFFLVPLPATLALIAYGGWRWTQADWGSLASRSHGYHVLGWIVLPLAVVAAALFATAIARGVTGRPTRWLIWATWLGLLAIFVLIFAPWPQLAACACDMS
jgi:hypothetical protein